MNKKATKDTFIPYENGHGRRFVQIPEGEEYIVGEQGIHIVSDMEPAEVEKIIEAEDAEPRREPHDITYMPNGLTYTSFDVAIFNPNGTEVIQYNRDGMYIVRERIIAKREKKNVRSV